MANAPIPEEWIGQHVRMTVLAVGLDAPGTNSAKSTPLGARNLTGLLDSANDEGVVVRDPQLDELSSFFPWSAVLAIRFPVG
jgi:hypothetical protein